MTLPLMDNCIDPTGCFLLFNKKINKREFINLILYNFVKQKKGLK